MEKDPEKRITIAEIREHPWVKSSSKSMPSKESNCRDEIAVTEEEVKQAVKSIRTPIHILVSLLDLSYASLPLFLSQVMIKNMAKKKTLRNPYSLGITKSPSPSPRYTHTIPSSGHTSLSSYSASLTDSFEAQERRETFASRRPVVLEDSPPSSQ